MTVPFRYLDELGTTDINMQIHKPIVKIRVTKHQVVLSSDYPVLLDKIEADVLEQYDKINIDKNTYSLILSCNELGFKGIDVFKTIRPELKCNLILKGLPNYVRFSKLYSWLSNISPNVVFRTVGIVVINLASIWFMLSWVVSPALTGAAIFFGIIVELTVAWASLCIGNVDIINDNYK